VESPDASMAAPPAVAGATQPGSRRAAPRVAFRTLAASLPARGQVMTIPALRATIVGQDGSYVALVQDGRLDRDASRDAFALAIARSALRLAPAGR
jgi:hypothetical protein